MLRTQDFTIKGIHRGRPRNVSKGGQTKDLQWGPVTAVGEGSGDKVHQKLKQNVKIMYNF